MSSTPWAGRRLHFVGVGGAGMSGLALVAKALGAEVTGSDRAESSYVERLRQAGLEPAIGHDAANVPDGAEVVVSTAIADDNPELAAARERGTPVLHRGDLLGELTRLRRTIAVGGTHGKTTTASMAAHILVEAGQRPGIRDRRRGALDRDERGVGSGGVAGRRGGRVGPLVPQAVGRGGGRHERRARPPLDLRDDRGARGGLRPLHRGGASRDLGDRGARGRARAARIALHARSGPSSSSRCPAATT